MLRTNIQYLRTKIAIIPSRGKNERTERKNNKDKPKSQITRIARVLISISVRTIPVLVCIHELISYKTIFVNIEDIRVYTSIMRGGHSVKL